MFKHIREMIQLIKEFTASVREAIAAYRELKALWDAETDGGMTATEENAVLADLTTNVEKLEQLGKE
jgi:hypothetical protein